MVLQSLETAKVLGQDFEIRLYAGYIQEDTSHAAVPV